MKRLFMLTTLALFASLTPIFGAIVNDNEQPSKEYWPIDVKKEPTNFHRSLEDPIFAYYAAGTINIDFVENLGPATVAVLNVTFDGQVVELIDTSMGNVVIDIDSILTVGDYYMTITTMSGDMYYADFTLE